MTKMRDTVANFVAQSEHAADAANNSLVGVLLADVFATEVTEQLYLIKGETVLVSYLQACLALKEVKLETVTAIKLQAVLYNMASPVRTRDPRRERV